MFQKYHYLGPRRVESSKIREKKWNSQSYRQKIIYLQKQKTCVTPAALISEFPGKASQQCCTDYRQFGEAAKFV